MSERKLIATFLERIPNEDRSKTLDALICIGLSTIYTKNEGFLDISSINRNVDLKQVEIMLESLQVGNPAISQLQNQVRQLTEKVEQLSTGGLSKESPIDESVVEKSIGIPNKGASNRNELRKSKELGYGSYPAWWGFQEYGDENVEAWKWKCPVRKVDEICQTSEFGGDAFVTPPKKAVSRKVEEKAYYSEPPVKTRREPIFMSFSPPSSKRKSVGKTPAIKQKKTSSKNGKNNPMRKEQMEMVNQESETKENFLDIVNDFLNDEFIGCLDVNA